MLITYVGGVDSECPHDISHLATFDVVISDLVEKGKSVLKIITHDSRKLRLK